MIGWRLASFKARRRDAIKEQSAAWSGLLLKALGDIGMRIFGLAVIALVCLTVPSLGHDIQRPLIFVPGIAGSNLEDPFTGQEVFGRGRFTVENLEAIQLPTIDNQPKLIATRVLLGQNSLLSDSAERYGLLRQRLLAQGYEEGKTLFFFPYDWRQSNFDTAAELKDFLEENELAGRQIDLIAHSMGALVALIYIQENPCDQRVRNLVVMGAPHFGSTMALQALIEGFPAFGIGNWAAVGAGNYKSVFRVFSSFESIYELLPLYPDCCFAKHNGKREKINILRRQSWVDHRLLANFLNVEEEKSFMQTDFVQRAFNRALALNQVVKKPLPSTIRKIVVANNRFASPTAVEINANGMGRHKWLAPENSGDSAVATKSALGPKHWTALLYSNSDHQFLFEDEVLWGNLERYLRAGGPEGPGWPKRRPREIGPQCLPREAANTNSASGSPDR